MLRFNLSLIVVFLVHQFVNPQLCELNPRFTARVVFLLAFACVLDLHPEDSLHKEVNWDVHASIAGFRSY